MENLTQMSYYERLRREAEAEAQDRARAAAPVHIPSSHQERSQNVMRPETFDRMVGQEPAKKLMRAAVEAAQRRGEPLAHTLLVGTSGTGKSTFAHVIANELHHASFQLSAPISYDTLAELRTTMQDGDVLFLDEIHLQAIPERRGKESSTQPEVLFGVMEDRVLLSPTGPLPFPKITLIGATTDPGRLPEPFLNRFPLRPRLVEYTEDELWLITVRNAQALGMTVTKQGARVIAKACAGVPRVVNNLVRNVAVFGDRLDRAAALEVLEVNGISLDGLTPQQQQMVTFLYLRGRRMTRDGVRYQASVGSIATALGLSRDVKAVALYVEPLLIKRGLVQVASAGRVLTDEGEARARELLA